MIESATEVVLVFGVVGSAMIWPPLGFLFAALFYAVIAAWHWHVARDADVPVTGQEVTE